MTGTGPETSLDDPRRRAILDAAFEAFRHYGFRRTSMADIADRAGMSRAALYLHYRNKEDIFRSLAQLYYDGAAQGAARALAGTADPVTALRAAFAAQAGDMVPALLGSAHGAELLDAKFAHGADIVRAGEARLVQVYADWLRARDAGEPDLTAAMMMAALHGVMKQTGPGQESCLAQIDRLAGMFGAALASG